MQETVVDKTNWNYTIIENEIIETDGLDIYEKMLYISLKRFANVQTGEAFPGVKKVAKIAGMSERKARDVIASLSEKGFIKVEHRNNQTNIYTLFSHPARHAVGGAQDAAGHARHAGGVMHTVQGGGAHGADELKKHELKRIELKKENNILSDSKNQTADKIPYAEIVDYLNQKCGTKFRASTQKTRNSIKARMNEGFKLENFKAVIEVKAKRWMNTNMQIYLRPETLFGNKFESYNEEAKLYGANRQSNRKNGFADGIDF